jgi:hypothetical protein
MGYVSLDWALRWQVGGLAAAPTSTTLASTGDYQTVGQSDSMGQNLPPMGSPALSYSDFFTADITDAQETVPPHASIDSGSDDRSEDILDFTMLSNTEWDLYNGGMSVPSNFELAFSFNSPSEVSPCRTFANRIQESEESFEGRMYWVQSECRQKYEVSVDQ